MPLDGKKRMRKQLTQSRINCRKINDTRFNVFRCQLQPTSTRATNMFSFFLLRTKLQAQ